MARATAAQETVIFRGPPRRLRLHSKLPALKDASFEPDDALKAAVTLHRPFRSRTDQNGRLRRVAARFDKNTPPGEYHATLRSAEGELPVLIQVEPHPRLSISPSALSFAGNVGSKPEAHLVFVNKGNVPLDIPQAITVSMCKDTGLDDAFTSTLLMDSKELDPMFSHFVDRLRATHGGLLPLIFAQGSGMLSPGDQVAAIARAEFTDRMAAGQSYHGILRLHSATQVVGVTVTP